jgi:mutator protein MutT
MMKKVQQGTLVFLRRDDEILLAMKKRGFGAGNWNGVGGKVEAGEEVRAAAIREAEEEIGVTPLDLKEVARLTLLYPEGEIKEWDGFVYTCTEWSDEPIETEEMAPRWFKLDDIPYEQMWADDPHWLPLVLAGKRVEAVFTFDADNQVTEHDVQVLTG